MDPLGVHALVKVVKIQEEIPEKESEQSSSRFCERFSGSELYGVFKEK